MATVTVIFVDNLDRPFWSRIPSRWRIGPSWWSHIFAGWWIWPRGRCVVYIVFLGHLEGVGLRGHISQDLAYKTFDQCISVPEDEDFCTKGDVFFFGEGHPFRIHCRLCACSSCCLKQVSLVQNPKLCFSILIFTSLSELVPTIHLTEEQVHQDDYYHH